MAEERYVVVSMVRVPSPLIVFTKPLEVRFESLVMFWVVLTLKALPWILKRSRGPA